MKTVVLASTNPGKIREIEALLAGLPIRVVSLDRYPALGRIEENGQSFLENALKKARTVAEYTGEAALADDSGLEVDALEGAPGIYSARYAGPGASDEDNTAKLLRALRQMPAEKRGAAFRCVIVLCEPDGSYLSFEGRWAGRISETPRGGGGFGYDPVFFLPEFGQTVAELAPEEKNRLSHRAQALGQLRQHFQSARNV